VEESEQVPPQAESASNWKSISFLLAGVLIPIVAALLPWLLENWTPRDKLAYTLVGPISTDGATAFQIVVRNEGRALQSNVEVWIPLRRLQSLDPKLLEDAGPEMKEWIPKITLDASTKPTKEETRDDFTILYYEKLRSDESVTIKLFATGKGLFIQGFELERMRIVSDNTLAQLDERDEFVESMFRVGTALFVLFVGFVFVYAVYYENFMPKERKRAELLKQLGKLDA